LLDPQIASKRNLDIFVYALDAGRRFDEHYGDLMFLKEIGFNVSPHIKKLKNKRKCSHI